MHHSILPIGLLLILVGGITLGCGQSNAEDVHGEIQQAVSAARERVDNHARVQASQTQTTQYNSEEKSHASDMKSQLDTMGNVMNAMKACSSVADFSTEQSNMTKDVQGLDSELSHHEATVAGTSDPVSMQSEESRHRIAMETIMTDMDSINHQMQSADVPMCQMGADGTTPGRVQ